MRQLLKKYTGPVWMEPAAVWAKYDEDSYPSSRRSRSIPRCHRARSRSARRPRSHQRRRSSRQRSRRHSERCRGPGRAQGLDGRGQARRRACSRGTDPRYTPGLRPHRPRDARGQDDSPARARTTGVFRFCAQKFQPRNSVLKISRTTATTRWNTSFYFIDFKSASTLSSALTGR